MFKDVTIGQYIPGNSPIHKIHPPLKIIFVILYIVVLFMISKWTSYAVFTLFTAALVLVSGIKVRIILKGLKPMLWIIIFTALINIFMTPGEVVWTIPIWRFSVNLTREGLIMGAVMTIRLVYLVVGTSLLTLTTSPLQLTDGIEKLLSPLRVIKVPARAIDLDIMGREGDAVAAVEIPVGKDIPDKTRKGYGADFGAAVYKRVPPRG